MYVCVCVCVYVFITGRYGISSILQSYLPCGILTKKAGSCFESRSEEIWVVAWQSQARTRLMGGRSACTRHYERAHYGRIRLCAINLNCTASFKFQGALLTIHFLPDFMAPSALIFHMLHGMWCYLFCVASLQILSENYPFATVDALPSNVCIMLRSNPSTLHYCRVSNISLQTLRATYSLGLVDNTVLSCP